MHGFIIYWYILGDIPNSKLSIFVRKQELYYLFFSIMYFYHNIMVI